MKVGSTLRYREFSRFTASHPSSRNNAAKKKRREMITRFVKQYQAMFVNVTATALTGTVFLGGSYLFFIQLAKYGW